MVAYKQSRTFTPEEYLDLERKSHYKSEYLEGQIYAMSGGSLNHGATGANVIIAIGKRLPGTPCRIFSSNVKVRTTTDGLFTYPDASIVCGDVRFHDDKQDVIVNPIVLVEVLSPSTEAYDRVGKWEQYQTIDSLQTYVLIAQHQARVEQYARQPNGDWLYSPVTGRNQSLYIASIDCTLALSEIYDRVEFPAPPVNMNLA